MRRNKRLARRAVAALACLVLPGGCAMQGGAGDGPLTLAPDVLAGYRDFRELENPGYFAVAPDGTTYGYSFCADPRCRGHSAGVALWSCNQNRADDDCRIYAYRDKILWKYPDTWTPPNGFTFERAAATLPRAPLQARLFNAPGGFPGSLYMGPDLAYGGLEMTGLPQRGDCRGVMRRTNPGGGQWEAVCSDGAVLVGLFHIESGGAGIRGFTAGRNGGRLEFSARVPDG